MKNKLFTFPVIVTLLIAIVFVILYIIASIGPFDKFLFDFSLAIVIVLLSIFFIQSQKKGLKGFWLKPSYLFILGYLAVNLQFIADFRLGLKDANSDRILYPDVLNQCLILAIVGLAAFVLGYSYYNRIAKWKSATHSIRNIHGNAMIIIIVQLVVFALFLYNINLATFLSGADYGLAGNNIANYFENLLYVCNAVIIVFAISNNKISSLHEYFKSIPLISLLVIILYIIMRLLSGDRGPFIYTILLLLFGYLFATRKKIKLVFIVVAGLSAMLFVSVIGIARHYDTNESFIQKIIVGYDSYREEGRFGSDSRTVMGLTEELGSSFMVNQIDVNAIENENANFHYGTYQLINILNSIPFMPGFIANVLHVSPENRSSSGFANYHFFNGYDRNWGLGTTCLGDFYLDLGVFGVLLGFFVAGILLKLLDITLIVRNNDTIDIFTCLFVLLFSAKSIYMPRSVLMIDLQSFVLGYLLIFLNNFILRKARN